MSSSKGIGLDGREIYRAKYGIQSKGNDGNLVPYRTTRFPDLRQWICSLGALGEEQEKTQIAGIRKLTHPSRATIALDSDGEERRRGG